MHIFYVAKNAFWPFFQCENRCFLKKLLVTTDRISEIGFLGTQNQPKNGFMPSGARIFFIFAKKFCGLFDDFSKFCSTFGMFHFTLKNHQICQKFGIKMKKSLVALALNPFLHGNCIGTRNPDFGCPFHYYNN